jgi:hypothetical protein
MLAGVVPALFEELTMSGSVTLPFVSVDRLIELLQAAQAGGCGSFPVLLGGPDQPLVPVTVVEHIVSEGVLLRA